MFSQRYKTLPFHQASSLFLSWMTMLMVFIAVLTLAGSLSLSRVISAWNHAISGSLTVQIPTYSAAGESRGSDADEDVKKTLDFLKAHPNVVKATLVTDDKMEALMEPWLGVTESLEELPLPKLIDVELEPGASFDFIQFKNSLYKIAPLAEADSHRIWLAQLIDTATGLHSLILFILFLLVLTTSFTVVYTTSSNMALQSDTIKLLHMMGAKDGFVAIRYASWNFIRSFMGGCVGLIVALPVLWMAYRLFAPLRESMAWGGALEWADIWTILGTPLIAGALSFITAYATVLKILRRFL